jgi:DNA processing protein
MNREEVLYTLALTQLSNIGPVTGRTLCQRMGSAKAVYDNRGHLVDAMPDINRHLAAILEASWDKELQRAEEELLFDEKKSIKPLVFTDEEYPSRLRECNDAPLLLFYRGNANLNTKHVIDIVGTRHATEYGRDFCTHFVADIAHLLPGCLIVSGLAFGIDICAHRAALSGGLPTVGVLAHGLDRIYPFSHRTTAVKMLEQGGLLTEFPIGTQPDRFNFISRNRIVAGMSDATIVVESAHKGGALITARLADAYHRDIFAVPGRLTDQYSEGCNELIRLNGATLLTDAETFAKNMMWDVATADKKKKPIEPELFPNLTEEEQRIVSLLRKTDGMQINTLTIQSNIPINRLNAMLFELEMKGIVKPMVGGMYRAL